MTNSHFSRSNSITTYRSKPNHTNNISFTHTENRLEAQNFLSTNRKLLIFTDCGSTGRLDIHWIEKKKLIDVLKISLPFQSMDIQSPKIVDEKTISITISKTQFIIHIRSTAATLLEKLKIFIRGSKVGKNGFIILHEVSKTQNQ